MTRACGHLAAAHAGPAGECAGGGTDGICPCDGYGMSPHLTAAEWDAVRREQAAERPRGTYQPPLWGEVFSPRGRRRGAA